MFRFLLFYQECEKRKETEGFSERKKKDIRIGEKKRDPHDNMLNVVGIPCVSLNCKNIEYVDSFFNI